MAQQFWCQLLPILFLLFTSLHYVSAAYPRSIRNHRAMRRFSTSTQPHADLSPDFVAYNYSQTLDHFNYKPESYATFQQRYIMNFKYWGGANMSSPIFVYTGEESSVTDDIPSVGFIIDLASRFKGLLLYIEHRYYGDSMPFGSEDEAFRDASTLGFFSSEQALADYAQVITDVKKNLSAQNCPVIAVGGSYGGMLASWLRLKYPHIVNGALASSSPILYFEDITPQDRYFVVVSKDFRDYSESCYNTIKQSWSEIDRVAAESNGIQILSSILNFCSPLKSEELKDILRYLYAASAQYDNPPDYPVSMICTAIDGTPQGTEVLDKIAAGLNAITGGKCIRLDDSKPDNKDGWTYQTCTELVIPLGNGENDTMFQAKPFDLNNYTKDCQALFNVTPKPNWITTEFGGHNIKSVLGHFASNIIFSNGLRDPYSSGGVLEDISDTVVAVYTNEGAHCLDILTPSPGDDPDWLVAQRNKEMKIIESWINGDDQNKVNVAKLIRNCNAKSILVLILALVYLFDLY